MFVFLIFIASISVASAATITVNNDGGADYTSIQDAINNASDGDFIEVWNGTYIENVDVNKRLTIYARDGAGVTVVQAANSNHVFDVTADYVNISGFTVTGATSYYYSGIYLSYADHCNISDNIASYDYWYGIYLLYSSNNTLTNNTANENNKYGIYLLYSSNNMLTNNTMSGNEYNFGISGSGLSHYNQNIDTSNKMDGKPAYYWTDQQDKVIPGDAGYVGVVNSTNITVRDLAITKNYKGVLFAYTSNSKIENVSVSNNFYGIHLFSSSNNTLTNNTTNENNHCGIHLSSSSNNTLTNNTANEHNHCGICLFYSSNNTLSNNIANSNNRYGIYLYSSSSNTFTNNTANSNNYYGIELDYSNNNTLMRNTVDSNNHYGIWLSSSNSNIIYHNNFINNINQATDTNPANNKWYNTSLLEGNYWSDYTGIDDGSGTGKHSIASDGIGDTLIPHPAAGYDIYPFMNPNGWDTTPPIITFVPPTPANNSEVTVDYVLVKVTLNENGNTAILNWNGTNETMSGAGMNFYLNKTGLSNGIYTFKVYANDTADNWNVSETRVVAVNVAPGPTPTPTPTPPPPVEVPAITPLSFLLALLSLFGLGAVAMRRMYKR